MMLERQKFQPKKWLGSLRKRATESAAQCFVFFQKIRSSFMQKSQHEFYQQSIVVYGFFEDSHAKILTFLLQFLLRKETIFKATLF
jgi:hypothetical protein